MEQRKKMHCSLLWQQKDYQIKVEGTDSQKERSSFLERLVVETG